ncbi:tetratricopeptide repeat protein [Nocardia fluminea]|uniref:tetratricopeptide repeat protein n=1 Tax=Nocardia fluminea TaxID=134984 RepID=UPI001180BEA2|nr:hypothetical protein [Nocardia fluminea]
MQDLWLDGSISPEAHTHLDLVEQGVLDKVPRDVIFGVEAVPEPDNEHETTPVALILYGHRVGYLADEMADEIHSVIVQANSIGLNVKMRARVHWDTARERRLEIRGTWPSNLWNWLALPTHLRGSKFFEIDWSRTSWGEEFQSQRKFVLQNAGQLITECRVQLCEGGHAIDVYMSGLHVATAYAGYSDYCERAVRRVADGQLHGYGKIRRISSGHILVNITVADPHGEDAVQRGRETFLWPDERDAVERAEREQAQRAWSAGLVDGKDVRQWFEKVRALKRAGKNRAAIQLLERMLDAEDASSAIIETPPTAWITEQAAIVYRKLNNIDSEIAVLQRYLRRIPSDKASQTIISRLKSAQYFHDSPS